LFSPLNLFAGILAGAIGAGYFIYGKKRHKLLMVLCGLALMIYPYLFESLAELVLVGIGLVALPWFFTGE